MQIMVITVHHVMAFKYKRVVQFKNSFVKSLMEKLFNGKAMMRNHFPIKSFSCDPCMECNPA